MNGWVKLVRHGSRSLGLACRAWSMLLLDACKHNGATCCENDSMSLLHTPRPCLAGGLTVGFMQTMHVRWRWLILEEAG